MGILSSAYSWLTDKLNVNKIYDNLGVSGPKNVVYSSSPHSFGTPIKVDSDSGVIKSYDPVVNAVSNAVTKGVTVSHDDLTRPKYTASTGGHSAEEVYSAPVTPAQLQYLNAELASHYGMSKETAYQEALSNTAYQRSVKDMQAAGLNPAVLYGAGKGSPADGVYSVRSASSGGSSGGSSRGSAGSSKNNDKLFSTGQFYGLSAAAGLIGAIATGRPDAYWIFQTATQGAMTAANSLLKK